MALRSAPKRKVDYGKLDDLQKEIFGSDAEEKQKPVSAKSEGENFKKNKSTPKNRADKNVVKSASADKNDSSPDMSRKQREESPQTTTEGKDEGAISSPEIPENSAFAEVLGGHLSEMEGIAARIVAVKAGQGRNTTRPFSIPRTLIIDTTRLKAKFRTIDEQFTQNVIIDFLLREALTAVTPENYKDLRTAAFEFIKRPEETTRRSLTVTEEVVYQMSELKAGINLETGKKYSNDEIFSTLLALGVSWLYRNGVLT